MKSEIEALADEINRRLAEDTPKQRRVFAYRLRLLREAFRPSCPYKSHLDDLMALDARAKAKR